ncbi:unnamed protein product [Auanema sp. JU1783]|nr:unnamed protein product [Auanema sp. JU1783]
MGSVFQAFNEIVEDDFQRYQICGCLHSFLACFFFEVFDISAVLITAGLYYLVSTEIGWSPDITIPVTALGLSFLGFFFGPIGLLSQKAWMLTIYNVRLIIVVIFSFSWMSYAFMKHEERNIFVAFIWFCAALLYLWGTFVTTCAVTYLEQHYRGYDDVDYNKKKMIDEKLVKKLEELKQIELDESDSEISNKERERKNDLQSGMSMNVTRRSSMIASNMSHKKNYSAIDEIIYTENPYKV